VPQSLFHGYVLRIMRRRLARVHQYSATVRLDCPGSSMTHFSVLVRRPSVRINFKFSKEAYVFFVSRLNFANLAPVRIRSRSSDYDEKCGSKVALLTQIRKLLCL